MRRLLFDTRFQLKMAWGLLILMTLVYTIAMGHQVLLRYDTFKATAFDLGNMDQVLWNTIHGRLFQFTNQAIDWYGPPTRLAIHFEPILLPLSLLYAFHADPRTLLIFQTLALAIGALPVFLLTRKHLPSWPLLAMVMAGAYFLSPALLGLNLFDFHPVSLATPLLLFAILALDYKRYVWFLLLCILAAACKEEVPLDLALFGLLLIWKYKLPRLGITLLLGGALWSLLAFKVIIPHFYSGVQANNFWYRYEALGSSPAEAIANILLHPWLLFTTFITLDRFYYLAGLFRSGGFFGLFAPEWLIPALPSLAVNLLSTDPFLYSGVYHYNAVIIPFIMVATIHGIRRCLGIWQTWRTESLEEVGLVTKGIQPPFRSRYTQLLGRLAAQTRAFLAFLSAHLTWLIRLTKRTTTLAKRQWQRFTERTEPLAKSIPTKRLQWAAYIWIVMMIGLNYLIILPWLSNFWADHNPDPREQHIQQLLAMIPPDASVSAGSNLNPHLSERQRLAVFPSISDSIHHETVQYIIVDLNAVFPEDRSATATELNHLVQSGQFRELARAEGVVLLVRT